MMRLMIEIEMRVVRLITFLYGECNIIGMIVIINIYIRDKVVLIIPLVVIDILNTPVEVMEIIIEI